MSHTHSVCTRGNSPTIGCLKSLTARVRTPKRYYNGSQPAAAQQRMAKEKYDKIKSNQSSLIHPHSHKQSYAVHHHRMSNENAVFQTENRQVCVHTNDDRKKERKIRKLFEYIINGMVYGVRATRYRFIRLPTNNTITYSM